MKGPEILAHLCCFQGFFFSSTEGAIIGLPPFFPSLPLMFSQSGNFSSSQPKNQAEPQPASMRGKPVRSTSDKGQAWATKSLRYALQLIQHISSTTLKVRDSLVDQLFLPLDLDIVGCGLCRIAHQRGEILPEGKARHLPELITVNFTGNKVCWIHSAVAIDQKENKWSSFNPADSRNVWWCYLLICTTLSFQTPLGSL